MTEQMPARESGLWTGRSLPVKIILGTFAALGFVALGLYIASFFLDGMVRPQIESRMNASLKGYHVTLGHAHLELLGLRLTLRRLTLVQTKDPKPPIAYFPAIHFHLFWGALFTGHVVATVKLLNPMFHINGTQVETEQHGKIPLRKRGWQNALQSAYPFKINRLAIINADVTYIDQPNAPPLHLKSVDFVARNIRNIKEPKNVYPSHFRASMIVFGKGRLTASGKANFLMAPFPGMVMKYDLAGAPLGDVTPASQHVNLIVSKGTLSSTGAIEYSPKIAAVHVQNAYVDRANLTYVHLAKTRKAEKRRITKAGQTIKKENNRAAVQLDVQKMVFHDSRLNFKDQASNPPYVLYIENMNLTLTNLSNHQSQGLSHIDLTGDFMGSGRTHVFGTFVAAKGGPQFTTNIAIVKTDLPALNPLLKAHGRVEAAHGFFTLYAQLGLKDSRMAGYAKPLFSDVKVHPAKNKKKTILQRAEAAITSAAADLLKNRKTHKVASQFKISGNLKNPNANIWQAFAEVLRNAFVKAILPGFDRQLHVQARCSGCGIASPGVRT